MKKLLIAISALAASFSAAKADISLSGSAGLGLASGQGSSTTIVNGASIAFALSSDLGNGVVVSTKGGLSLDSDSKKAITGQAITGLHTLTFATGGSTVSVGADIDLAGDGVGETGAVSSDLNDLGAYGTGTVGAGLLNEDGYGIGLTTAIGAATFTGSYIMDNAATPNNWAVTDGTVTATGFQVSVPLGAMTIVAGYAQDDVAATGGTTTGVEGSLALGGGTLTVGTSNTNKNLAVADTRGYGAKFATTLGSASVSVGYRNREDTTNSRTSTVTSASVSQSIGAGASVFLDIANYSGYTTASSDKGTNVAIGTTFTF